MIDALELVRDDPNFGKPVARTWITEDSASIMEHIQFENTIGLWMKWKENGATLLIDRETLMRWFHVATGGRPVWLDNPDALLASKPV